MLKETLTAQSSVVILVHRLNPGMSADAPWEAILHRSSPHYRDVRRKNNADLAVRPFC